jgi:hypothetical protein
MCSIIASSCSSERIVIAFACSSLCSRGTRSMRILQYADRLRRGHASYCALAVAAEMAQQGRNELLVQNRAVTRAMNSSFSIARLREPRGRPPGRSSAFGSPRRARDHSTSACQCVIYLRIEIVRHHSAALGTWSGSLARWRKSEPSAEQRSFKRTMQTIASEPTWPASFSRNAWGPTWAETRFQTPAEEVGGPLRGLVSFFGGIAEISAVAP